MPRSWLLLVDPNHSQIPAQPLLAAHRPSQARPLLSLRASFHLLLPFTRFPHFLLSYFSILVFLFSLKTRFQLILTVQNHYVTKNLTDHRMHIEGPQLHQMNRQINSFQNMCDMLKTRIDRLARKIAPQSPIFVCTNRLPDFGRPWTTNG